MPLHTKQSLPIQTVIRLFVISLIPTVASADDDLTVVSYIPNFVSVDYGKDNDNGSDMYLFTNLGITLKDRLLLGIGKQVQTVAQSEEKLDNKTYLIGYNYVPRYESQYGAEFERWGDASSIRIDSYRFLLAFGTRKFSVMLTPEYRRVKINNSSNCDGNIESNSLKLNASFEISPQYSLNSSYVSYNYDDNLYSLSACVSGSERTLVESRIDSVTDDRQVSVGVDYYINSETYGMSFQKARTALNKLNYHSFLFYVSTDKYDDWTFTANLEIIENIDNSTTVGLKGTVTYYW